MVELTINEIEAELKHQDSPSELARFLTLLASYYSNYLEQMKKIALIKPQRWLAISLNYFTELEFDKWKPREKPLTDKKTDMEWACTKDGQQEIELDFMLKRIQKLYSSINSRLRNLEVEWKMSRSL